MEPPDKRPDPAGDARMLVALKRVRNSGHAKLRMRQEDVTDFDIRQIIQSGSRAPAHDEYKAEKGGWNYAMRGALEDERTLHVSFSFIGKAEEDRLLIVTVIDLDKPGTKF